MRTDLIARDAPTSVRRACPLCPADMPDLEVGEVPDLHYVIDDPEPIDLYHGRIIEYPAPRVIAWVLDCGHTVDTRYWCCVTATLDDFCENPAYYFWWVPRAVFDAAS